MTERHHFEGMHVVGSTYAIKIDLQGMQGHGMDCSGSGQGQVLGVCESGTEKAGDFVSSEL